jgi:hypothetical protein
MIFRHSVIDITLIAVHLQTILSTSSTIVDYSGSPLELG